MGGQIDFDSTEGIGSEFRVTLEFPVVAGAEVLTAAQILTLLQGVAETPRSSAESQTLPLAGRHLLVAEDIEVNQMIIQHMLESLGATITLVDNGRAAVERIQRGEVFDLILMDIQMPEMDGYAATREIRKLPNGKAIPIIAMTANAMATDIQTCHDAGMNAHIGKPIDPEDLLKKVLGQGRV
jgi:CheY-like chemotaxis protein